MGVASLSDSYPLGFSKQASFGPPLLHPCFFSLPIFVLGEFSRSQAPPRWQWQEKPFLPATHNHGAALSL